MATTFNVFEISGLQELWNETLGNPNVCIAILDGPVDQSHPSLVAANLTRVATLVSGTGYQGSASQHGTHIASVIFGQHDGPVMGIAPQCRGLIVPIFKDGVGGSIAHCSQVDLARAISQSVQEGAQIINISGGELTPSDSAHPLLSDTVRDCANRGVLIVAAAGNQGCACLHIPGALPSVLAVGAMNSHGEPLDFSNWGEKYQAQGILAPGEDIVGASPSGGTATNSGTSYATPIVSSVAALLLSLQIKYGQKPNPHDIRKIILKSAIGCKDQPVKDCRRLLAGRLNIKDAMSQIMKGGIIMPDPKEIRDHLRVTGVPDKKSEVIQTQKSDIQAAELDYSESEDTESSQQHSIENPPVSQELEESIKQKTIESSSVKASECNCNSSTSSQLVYTIGQLGFDYGSEANRDSIMQSMFEAEKNPNPNPNDPVQLLDYFQTNPWEAASIIWTMNFDTTPIYAIQGGGAFATEIYSRLREFLCEQNGGQFNTKTGGCDISAGNQNGAGVERISIGGHIAGQIRLLSGQVVPVIWSEPRCMFSWNTSSLLGAVSGQSSFASKGAKKQKTKNENSDPVRNFLERVYYGLRNLGIDPRDRAINYAATNALNAAKIFESAIEEKMQLDTIECEPSAICRPGSDCMDVKLIFFDPENLMRARKVHRFTVDVSYVCPVMVGPVRSWYVR